jgi:hypothetical protein
MPEMMALVVCLSQCIEPTTLRQLGRVIEAMLSSSGRVTRRGRSRWSGQGGIDVQVCFWKSRRPVGVPSRFLRSSAPTSLTPCRDV